MPGLTPMDVGGDVTQILVGSVVVYTAPIGTALPNIDGSRPVVWPAPIVSPLTTGWTKVGYTDKGVDWSYAPTYKSIRVDEEVADVRKILDNEKVTLSIKLSQATLANLALAISASTFSQSPADPTHSALDILVAGSGVQSEIMVGFQGYSPEALATNPPKELYRFFVGYRAIVTAKVDNTYQRAAQVLTPVDFELLADSTKTLGQRLFKLVDETAAHS